MNIHTLTKRAQFLAVAANRREAVAKAVILQALPRGDGQSGIRVGYTATRRVGNAVERNRIKRRLRAVVREVLAREKCPAQDGWDYVLVGRKATLERPYDGLVKDLLYCLHQVKEQGCS